MVRMMITEVCMQLEDIGRKEAVTLVVGLEAAPTVAMDPTAMECVVEGVHASPGSVVIAVCTKDALAMTTVVGRTATSVGHA